jgi:hypothetical protein
MSNFVDICDVNMFISRILLFGKELWDKIPLNNC